MVVRRSTMAGCLRRDHGSFRRVRGVGARLDANAMLRWGGLVVSGVFAYLAVRHVDFAEVSTGLRSSDYWWLVPAFAMLCVTVVVRALRWRYLFAPETRPPFGPTLVSLLVGSFFN